MQQGSGSVAVKPKREATTANMDHGNLMCMEATFAVKPPSGTDVASKSIKFTWTMEI